MTSATPPLLLAIDGNSLIHRAHHATEKSQMRGPAGQPTWAAHTFLSLLLGAYDRFRPDAVLIGIDHAGVSRRRERYPAYKDGRSEKSEELRYALGDIPTMLTQMGLSVITPEGLEADDVMASAAKHAASQGWRTIVVTSDRDAFALVNANTAVLRLTNGGIASSPLVTRHTFAEHAKCPPGRYTDYAAMRGDSSDNLPGARGIGEKTAGKLLETFETVTQAWQAGPASVASVIGRSASAKLFDEEAMVNVRRNLDLMVMLEDLPIPDLDTLRPALDLGAVESALNERGLGRALRAVSTRLCGSSAAEVMRRSPAPGAVDPYDARQPHPGPEPQDMAPPEPGYAHSAPAPVLPWPTLPESWNNPAPTAWPATA